MKVAVLLLLLAQPALAAETASAIPGAEVGRLIRAAMMAAGETVPDFPDPVRAFPACDNVPTVLPRQGNWATAELRCSAPVWSRAVRTGAAAPVPLARANASSEGPLVVTLARSVPKGALLTADDLTLAPAGARTPDGIFTDMTMVVGRRTRAALGEGQTVLLRQLEPVWLVAKGNPVILMASAGGLAVSASAEALEDGAMGDVIRVTNLSSGRPVKAVVTGPNAVMAQTNMR